MKYLFIYFIIGFVVAIINLHLLYLLNKKKNPNAPTTERPDVIIILLAWTLLWPIGLTNTVYIIKELYKLTKYKNGNN